MNNKTLNLYLLTQYENDNYDTYDSCVVAAYNKEEAVKIHPYKEYYENYIYCPELDDEYELWNSRTWVSSPDKVTCELIGIATKGIAPNSVICSSFNAG